MPPLEGRETPSAPDWYTEGGKSAPATKDTRISVPEPAHYHPTQAGESIVSMPGSHPQTKTSDTKLKPSGWSKVRFHAKSLTWIPPIDMVVYFQDKTGLHLTVEDGQHMEAGELFELVMEEMKLQPVAREVFSLWLVSDLLELQLKPNHVPFKLACYWEELLEKYTTTEEDDRERDEPILLFQRNVFYPRSKEVDITDLEILKLLYHEAKEMVIDGRYPLKQTDYDYLAGLQALIRTGEYSSDTFTPDYYRDKLREFYPEHMAKPKKSFGRRSKDSPEFRLARKHEETYQSYGKITDVKQVIACLQAYLDFCRKLPYYGGAFFRGQVEHPSRKSKLLSNTDDPVWIVVNTEGVYIIDMDDVVFLIGLPFEELSWEYAEPKEKTNQDCMPCIFLQFKGKNNPRETKMLQVFTREAALIDAIIEACITLKKKTFKGKDSTDGQKVTFGSEEAWQDFSRLCLTTFNERGEMVDSSIRSAKS